jgi:hypothetical protein
MTLAADAKKVAAQFSKVAKVKALTEQLRDAYGTTITRKDLKEFEKNHKLVVQWVARREDPVQKFLTPLGFVRSGRSAYAIPTDPTVLVNEAGTPVTVTAPEVLPDPPLSAGEQAVADAVDAALTA